MKIIESGTQSDLLGISSSEPFELKLSRFYFPGWKASSGGEDLTIEITEPDGRILDKSQRGI